jgi:hypothetical protein
MKYVKNIIFSLLPLLVLLGLVEFIARLIAIPKTVEPSTALQDIYNQKAIGGIKGNRPVSAQLNSYGFRGQELNFDKQADQYVVVLLGGSVATGAWAAKYENTPAQALETLLQKHIQEKYAKKLVVYSLAESGSDIEDEAFWLLKLGLYLKPDAVISLTGFNNMSNSNLPMWDKSSGGRAFQRAMLLHKPEENEGVQVTAKKFMRANYLLLVKKSRAMAWIDYLLFAEKVKNEAKTNVEKEIAEEQRLQKQMIEIMAKTPKPATMPVLAAQRFTQTAIQINEICKRNNSKYFVVLQPFKSAGKNLLADLPTDGTKDNRSQYIYRTLAMNWKEQNPPIPYIDMSLEIGDQLFKDQQFGDDCHLWDDGFVLLNQTMANWLKVNL